MATNVFKPYKTTQANLSKIAYKAGQLIFTTDTRRIYIDTSNVAAGRLLVSADTVVDVTLGNDKRTLTFTKADGSTVNHTIVINIDNALDTSSINPVQNSVVATAIAELQSAINKNAGDIADHAETLASLSSQDDSLLEKIEQNADDIATNANDISTLQGNVSTLQGNVSSLQTKDGQLQTSINNVSNELSSFKTSTGTNFTNVNSSITNIVNGTTVVAKATNAVSADSAATATKATKDGNNNIITSTYETKTAATQKLSDAKTYAEEKANAALSSAKSDAASKVSAHNTSTTSHNDIRLLIEDLNTKVTHFLDVDDTTTDQLSEVLALINNNKGTLESLLADKVNITDIIDNLTTTTAGKVLSANQGKVLKSLIDALTNTVNLKANSSDLTTHVNNKSNPHAVTKAQVGLGNVNNTADLDKPVSTAQATAIADAKKAGTDAQTNLTTHINNQENPHNVTLSQLGVNASAAELNYVKGVTSAVQTQLNNKANKSDIPTKYAGSASAGGPATSANKLASAQTISLSGDVSGSASFDGSKAINIAVVVADDSHNHVISNVDGLQNALNGKAASSHNHTKSQITDLNKQLSSEDLNNIKTVGFYYAGGNNTVTNKPSGVDAFGLEVIQSASGWYIQILYASNSVQKTYRRWFNSSSWTSWTEDKLTDTNTWRGIQNNLTSDSTTDSLAAAQGKALKALIDGKAASSHTHSAYVNQNAFSKVTVGSTTVEADNATDTLTLVAGSNITLTPDATNDKITIAAKDTNTHYESGTIVNNSTTATSNTSSALTNGNVYLNHIENGSVKNSHKISGSGATTVTSDASGNIIISSTDNNTVYTHPTTSGNKHIPSGGSSGQILRWSADGTAVWGADNNTTYSDMKGATASAAGTRGLVPAPGAGKQGQYLRGDGTWATPTNTTYDVATSSSLGLVKSGTDITVDSSGNVSVNDDSHNHIISNVDGLQTALDGKAASSHTHDDRYYTESEINTKLNAKLNTSLKGVAGGLAELDTNGKVPSSQLPSYVDDVIEGYLYNSKFYKESAHTTEIKGESGKIYIDLSSNKTYRWSGSTFTVVSETLALGETSSTAYRGDRGKTAYDHSQTTHARTDATNVTKSTTNGNIIINGAETVVYTHPSGTNPHKTTKSDVGLGNVPNVATNDQTPTFSQASTRANIVSGEKLSVIFGKLMKWFADLKTVAFTGSYNDLSNKPTIPTVGNGTITIKQAGASKGTFTMNQSGNTTIELTDNNTTYGLATTSANGLMSAADKVKVNAMPQIVFCTQAEYAALGSATATDGKIYFIR